MSKLKIVSDGTALGTHVFSENTKITGIARIEILPIEPHGLVNAVLTFLAVEIDLVAELKDGA
jgi:hypothetical protein